MAPEILAAMIGLAVLAPAVWLYNRLVADRNLARQGFADIDVQLKRRADLVPPLVEAVRAYAAHEKALLTSIAEVRSAAVAAPKVAERFAHERVLGERLDKLVLLQESYPALKADANFRDLAQKLVEIEDSLQYARRFYNGAVQQYVTRIESFPALLIARPLGFRPMPFFETAERVPVKVLL
jgi:LemA protein